MMSSLFLVPPDRWDSATRPWSWGPSLYIAQEAGQGLVKVGVANHPMRRISELQTGNPHKISLVNAVNGTREECFDAEQTVLKAFSEHRLNGEWLRVSPDEVLEFVRVTYNTYVD